MPQPIASNAPPLSEEQSRRMTLDRETLKKSFAKLENELKIREQEIKSEQVDTVKLDVRNFITQNGGKIKRSDLKQRDIENLYKETQRARVKLIRQPAKITGAPYGSQASDEAAQAIAQLDEDYKLVRLIALLQDPNSGINEKFRATMEFLPAASREARETLKRRYKVIQGRELVQDLETQFASQQTPLEKLAGTTLGKLASTKIGSVLREGKGSQLQLPVLKQLLETGKVSPTVEVAAELGLLYRGTTVGSSLSQTSKEKIRKLIAENPGELGQLASTDPPQDGDNEDPLLPAVYQNLKKHHAEFFGEVQKSIRGKESDSSLPAGTPAPPTKLKGTGNKDADDLIGLLYDDNGKPRKIDDPEKLQQDILERTKSFSEAERTKFLESDKLPKPYRPADKLEPYQKFWYLLRVNHENSRQSLGTGWWWKEGSGWFDYTQKVVDAQRQDEATRRIHELNALLDYQASKPIWKRWTGRKATAAKVLNLLSSEDSWDADEAVKEYCQKRKKGDPKQWLERQLKQAGLNARHRNQVERQLDLKGAYPGAYPIDESRQMGAYQQLKREMEKNPSSIDWPPQTLVDILSQLEPGSFDYHLIREDEALLKRLQDDLKGRSSDDRKRNRLWGACANLLSLPDRWKQLGGKALATQSDQSEPQTPTPFNRSRLEQGKESAKEKYWASRMALEYSMSEGDDRRRKVLKLVFKAQLAGVEGAGLSETLKKIDGDASNWVSQTTLSPQRSERQAADLLRKYLKGETKEITMANLLAVSKGFLVNDAEMVAFSVEVLSPDRVVDLWFGESVKTLKSLAEKRRRLAVEMLSAQQDKNEARAKELTKQLQATNQAIDAFEIKMDGTLKTDLEKVAGKGKAADLQRQLLAKAGQAFAQGTSQTVRDIPLTPAETFVKGQEAQGKSMVLKQRFLESGRGWHRFSPAGTVSSLKAGGFLSNVSDMRRVLSLNPEKTDVEKETRGIVQDSLKDLDASLQRWQKTQDRNTEKIVADVTQTMSVLVAVAGLASGVGAAPAVTQLVWALSTAAGQTAVKQAVTAALSRSGDRSPQLVLKEVLTETAQGVSQFFLTNELAVGGNVAAISALGADTTGKQLVVKAGLKVATNTLTDVVSELTAAIVATPFESNSSDLDRFGKVFKSRLSKSGALGAGKDYARNFVERLGDLLYNAVVGYDRTTSMRKLYPTEEQREKALKNLFNFMDGAAQFVGGPTDNMGASVWMMDDAAGKNPWMDRVKNSLKTALYEELASPYALDRMQSFMEQETGVSDSADSSQHEEASKDLSLPRERTIENAVSKTLLQNLEGMGIKRSELREDINFNKAEEVVKEAVKLFPAAEQDNAKKVLENLRNTLQKEANESFKAQKELVRKSLKEFDRKIKEISAGRDRNPVSRHYDSPTVRRRQPQAENVLQSNLSPQGRRRRRSASPQSRRNVGGTGRRRTSA